jgi:ryanodine receptor 2
LSNYKPQPIDTTGIELPEEIKELIEKLAENTHETWARQRMKDGWTYGPQRDDAAREHPCLVPYGALPEGEKVYDRDTTAEALKCIMALGWRITKAP